MPETIGQMLIEDVRMRLLDESIPRIKKCLRMISEGDIHITLNDHTNSISQLVVHLDGNVRQWLISTFTKSDFKRMRSEEFGDQSHESISSLLNRLDMLADDIEHTLKNIDEDRLKATYHIQNFICTGVSVVIHVTEHFSYHTGQIAQLTKIIVNQATLFYDDSILNVS